MKKKEYNVAVISNDNKKAITLQDLPDEMKVLICSFLDIPDLASVSKVSRNFRDISNVLSIWIKIMNEIGIKGLENPSTQTIKDKIKMYHTVSPVPGQTVKKEPVTIESTKKKLNERLQIELLGCLDM